MQSFMRALLAALALTMFAASPTAAQSPDSSQTLARRADEYLTRITGYGFHGAFLVARGEQVLLAKGYGVADRGRGRPFTERTLVETGSITKQFTAAGILKLEMQGKLKVSDPITRFFPDVPEDKQGITLHHLLTHTSGWEPDLGGDYQLIGRDELVRAALAAPLRAAPGERFLYSNLGYSMLAAIIELVSGQPYEQYLRQRLFLSAGMEHTGYKLPQWDPELVPHGYEEDGSDWGTMLDKPWADDGPSWHLRGNGGMVSTLHDLHRWHVALLGDKLLSPAAKEKMFAPHVSSGPDSRYGYGWSIRQAPDGSRLIGHDGSNGIYHAVFRRYADGAVIFGFTNVAGTISVYPAAELERLLFGEAIEVPPAALPRPGDFAVYAGSFTAPSGGSVTVTAVDGALKLASEGEELYRILNSGKAAERAELEQLSRRTQELMRGMRAGEYGPLHAASGEGTLDAVVSRWRNFFTREEKENGPWQGYEVVGTAFLRTVAATLVRLDFERGVFFLELVWRDGKLLSVRAGSPPDFRFLPTGNDEFAAYNIATGALRRLRFHMAEGKADSVALRSAAGSIELKRE